MREKRFVEQNTEKWRRYESLSSKKFRGQPRNLSELYGGITNDLAYARTYYPHRSIRIYLNKLAERAYLRLYRRRTKRVHGFLNFWTDDLPLALYQSRRELDISFLFFAVAMAIGIFSSVQDPDFARSILGSGYIAETESNIASGDPMGVYKSTEQFDMFFSITFNNLLVALRTYILGAFFGVGTLMIMLYNGVMVGTFQYFFVERGLFQESFLTIWMHGALEISAIVIAGGAGLTLGRGLLYPGTLPRMQAFRLGARRSIKIMLGLAPVFITAAFIEGFFTRLTETPDVFRAVFIASCFLLVLLYFRIYPWIKFRNSPSAPYDRDMLIPDLDSTVEFRTLRTTREVFVATFAAYRKTLPPMILTALGAAILYTVSFYLLYGLEGLKNVDFTVYSFFGIARFFDFTVYSLNFYANAAFLTLVVVASLYFVKKSHADQFSSGFHIGFPLILKTAVVVCLFELSLFSGSVLVAALGIVAIPFLAFWLVASAVENLSLPSAFSRMLKVLSGARRHVFVTFMSGALISVLLLFIIDAPFTWFYVDVLQWNLHVDYETRRMIAKLSLVFINFAALGLVLPLIIYGQMLEYFSAREVTEAEDLSDRVAEIGVKRKAYGLEKE